MSHHALITDNQQLPGGYDTYSLLLIPDWKWLKNVGEERSYELFKHFKMFGDAVGPHHLAALLYNVYWGSYEKYVDKEAFSIIHGTVSSKSDAIKLALEGSFDPERINIARGGYDVIRAKYFCASYGLNFNDGPYIAFFEQKPDLPTVFYGPRHPEPTVSSENPTKPSFLIQFNGISFEHVLTLLNEMEYEIIRGDVDMRKLKASQFSLQLEFISKKIGKSIGKTIRVIKDVKDIVPVPTLQDIVKFV
jgi:hypothetical protein